MVCPRSSVSGERTFLDKSRLSERVAPPSRPPAGRAQSAPSPQAQGRADTAGVVTHKINNHSVPSIASNNYFKLHF